MKNHKQPLIVPSDPHKVLMSTFKWYLIISSIFSIVYCFVFTIIPIFISDDFFNWLMETLGHSAGFYPDYMHEIGDICYLNVFALLPVSLVLLARKNWYAILGILACGLLVYNLLYWAIFHWSS